LESVRPFELVGLDERWDDRLRGVAEASGFRLSPGGRFEHPQEDTGGVLYTLQNLRPDPFSAEMLRLTATNGVVFLLDVARLADPVRGFDQMKLAARRMAVTLGATNLYLLSRRYGRRLLAHRIARFLELTPSRLDRAEGWFARYGPWTLIFGRHIPGFRVPLTVAAGILKLRYRIFAISVAVSSAAWAGVFLLLGVLFGDSLERSIRSSPLVYGGVAAMIIVVVVGVAFLRSRRDKSGEERP